MGAFSLNINEMINSDGQLKKLDLVLKMLAKKKNIFRDVISKGIKKSNA